MSFPLLLDLNGYVRARDADYRYELFSVMVHAGGALGGHYYAFIRSFQDGRWHEFNDSSVSEARRPCLHSARHLSADHT